MIGVLVKRVICNSRCSKAYKIDENLDNNNCSRGKGLIGKLVLDWVDEILNTTETYFMMKK